jgi:hypothetical protein
MEVVFLNTTVEDLFWGYLPRHYTDSELHERIDKEIAMKTDEEIADLLSTSPLSFEWRSGFEPQPPTPSFLRRVLSWLW